MERTPKWKRCAKFSNFCYGGNFKDVWKIEKMQLVPYVSQPPDPTKYCSLYLINKRRSNYIKQTFERNAKTVLNLKRFLSKICQTEKDCLSVKNLSNHIISRIFSIETSIYIKILIRKIVYITISSQNIPCRYITFQNFMVLLTV